MSRKNENISDDVNVSSNDVSEVSDDVSTENDETNVISDETTSESASETVNDETTERVVTLPRQIVATQNREVYDLFGAIQVELVRDAATDKWTASFNKMSAKNANGQLVSTKGYRSEKASEYKSCKDHVFIALGRQMFAIALAQTKTTSTSLTKAQAIESSTFNAAKAHAYEILVDESKDALTDAEKQVLRENNLEKLVFKVDAYLANAS